MSKKGMFITFEGGEGGGKTTQINKLSQYLTSKGHSVLTTREPGGTPEGERIRDLIVRETGGRWQPMSEALLLMAARVEHIERVIKPSLAEGTIVISDRFADSTIAYQGYGHGLDLSIIENLSEAVLEGLKPDLTLILDIDPKEGVMRSNRRMQAEALQVENMEDRFENMDLSFHENVRKGFLDIAKKDSERCKIVDASRDIDQISAEVIQIVSERV